MKLFHQTIKSAYGTTVQLKHYFVKNLRIVWETIDFHKDFKIVCRNCLQKVRRSNKSQKERIESLQNSRKFATSTYLRSKKKRFPKFELTPAKPRKKLVYQEEITVELMSDFKTLDVVEDVVRMKVSKLVSNCHSPTSYLHSQCEKPSHPRAICPF